MNKLGFLLVLFFIGVFLGAQGKTVTAAADPYPPFLDSDNPTQGLSIEIIRAALSTQGYSLEMKFMPWARAVDLVLTGQVDILPDKWITEDGKKDFLFSEPYASNEVKFIKRKGDPFEYKGLESLTNKTIGTVKGYGYGDAFLKAKNFKRDEVPDQVTNIKKLLAGRIDLTLDDQIVMSALLKQTDPSLIDGIEFLKTPLSTNALYVASGLKNPRSKEIIAAFNKGLEIIKANKGLAEILKKYGVQ